MTAAMRSAAEFATPSLERYAMAAMTTLAA